ncbi:hypothetical protein TNCT_271031 [Trichonephila clavata]|uniref:Uncharacterized protein n=1 Tax=Trichonephila clavata TaxID=2740835 RepID=A0A8X6M0T5_TRICU|nr:hypothetical protein TNCT_271031 [Trichonephila clavata]
MGLSLQHLLSYWYESDDFVQHIVAEDKIWCHHFQPEVCQHVMVTSRLTKVLKIQSSAVSWKGDVDGLMDQRYHSDNQVKVAVLN